MPNVSDFPDSTWIEAEKAAIAGVPYKEISEETGIAETALRKRASEYQWAVPRRIAKLANEHKERSILTNRHKGLSKALTAENVAEEGQAYRLQIFKKAKKLALAGISNLSEPQNWKEMDTADRIVGRAAGLDKPAQNVQINLGGLFRPAEQMEEGVVLDVESETESDSSDNSSDTV